MIAAPPELADRWPCFVLVESRRASWTEVSEKMSICDVLDLIDACNALARSRPRSETPDEEFDQ